MEKSSNDFSLFILRLTSGAMMLIAHGWPKLMAYQTLATKFPDPLGVGSAMSLGLAIFAEVVCAALLAVGLFTRLASIPLIITMAVAAFHIHAADPWAKKELAVMYLACYIVAFFSGSGKCSLQKMLKVSASLRIAPLNWLMK